MSSFRFLHTADIHLDSPLKGLAGHEGSAAEVIRSATRMAFYQMVSSAIEEHVSFLIIAGDLYDGDWRDYNTGLFFSKQMGRLNAAGIPVFLLHGNHDAASKITRRLALPDNVKVFDARRPETFQLEEIDVALHGQSFRDRDVSENLALNYPDPLSGVFNIGVLHTGLGGIGGHENYAPCAINDLLNKGYDYWALGHVHQASVLSEQPYVVFPGNLQGRHIRETGEKSAYLVTVEDRQVVKLTKIHSDVVRWASVPVNVEDARNVGEVNDRIGKAIENAVADEADGRLLACRILLQGRTNIHEQLIACEENLLAEARASALGLGDDAAWVEKIVLSTRPQKDLNALAQHQDALGDLGRMLEVASSDSGLMSELENHIGKMVRALPPGARADVDDPILKLAIEGDFPALVSEVSPYLIARLVAEEDSS